MVSSSLLQAKVVRRKIERREPVLGGKPFGLAGPYEKLIGKVEFSLDPALPQNAAIIDLSLAPRNAAGGVEFTADFYLIKPADPARGNGKLFYEVGNRGGKAMLRIFQKSNGAPDPTTAADFGDGSLMLQGYSLLWMGWQWDVPEGQMRMDMPIATDHGAPISGLVRGNIILDAASPTALVADRGHRAYAPLDSSSTSDLMTVRDHPTVGAQRIPREQWKFVNGSTGSLEGGF